MKRPKMNNITGNFELYFNEFPDWSEHPPKGESKHSDSRIFEINASDGFFSYSIKVLVTIQYYRWFKEQSQFGPEEDEITDYTFDIECISGFREFKERELKLNEKELSQFDKILKDKITFA